MDTLLKIGTIDVSDYVLDGYAVKTQPVYDSTTFTNMLGTEVKTLIGKTVAISANLGEVPDETAQKIFAVCETNSLSVTYASPVTYTATFKRPTVEAILVLDTETERLWDISISMETGTIALDGL